VLRACVTSHRTSETDVRALIDALDAARRRVRNSDARDAA